MPIAYPYAVDIGLKIAAMMKYCIDISGLSTSPGMPCACRVLQLAALNGRVLSDTGQSGVHVRLGPAVARATALAQYFQPLAFHIAARHSRH